MKIPSIIKNIISGKSTAIESPEKLTDSFADTLSVDLKRAATEAIYAELQKVEEKYLSTILRQSYFPIESLAFHPIGHTTALELEEFFRVHSEIDPSFEENFFSSVLLREYRTNQGALAILPEEITPIIQPNESSLDNPTNEESYQISLRGNKKRFAATAKLGSPKQRSKPEPTLTKERDVKENLDAQRAIPSSTRLSSAFTKNQAPQPSLNNEYLMSIQIIDGNGTSNLTVSTPFIVGRHDATSNESGLKKVSVNGMYISRKQLVVFQINGVAYAFVPSEAKLWAIANSVQVLKNLQLFEIENGDNEITFGQPPESNHISIDKSQPQLYPTILIRRINSTEPSNGEATPIPGVTK
jgi:hypothetical protein